MLAIFDACYRIKVTDMGSYTYERIALPHAGGGADQDARTMQAMDIIERVSLEELREDVERRRSHDKNKREEPHEG